ncbi:MAG: four helix bundle protein [Pseudomonadota bacterium]
MTFAFEELQVYQKALDFSVKVIDEIDRVDTPRKHYRLIEQLEASSTSVALNISEGKGRFSKKEFRQFLYISRGSLYETITMLQIFLRKDWIDQDSYKALYAEAEEINKMLSGLITSINASL